MSDPGDSNIVVRVEVQVPLALVHGGEWREQRPKPLALLTVELPRPGGSASVWADSVSHKNFICARGGGAIKSGTPAFFVYAKVFPGSSPTIPAKPPPGTAAVTPDSTGRWSFDRPTLNLLDGAACTSGTTGAANVLALWTDFGGPAFGPVDTVAFSGVCSSTRTDCDPPSPPSGSGSGSGFAAGGATGALGLAAAPHQWTTAVSGFGGPGKAFNSVWVLTRHDAGQEGVWANDGDGKAAPRVDLHLDERQGTWLLRFRHGSYEVRFHKPAAEWNPLNGNIFPKAAGAAGHRGAVPEYVTLVPV
jgi:hypothetical protein